MELGTRPLTMLLVGWNVSPRFFQYAELRYMPCGLLTRTMSITVMMTGSDMLAESTLIVSPLVTPRAFDSPSEMYAPSVCVVIGIDSRLSSRAVRNMPGVAMDMTDDCS